MCRPGLVWVWGSGSVVTGLWPVSTAGWINLLLPSRLVFNYMTYWWMLSWWTGPHCVDLQPLQTICWECWCPDRQDNKLVSPPERLPRAVWVLVGCKPIMRLQTPPPATWAVVTIWVKEIEWRKVKRQSQKTWLDLITWLRGFWIIECRVVALPARRFNWVQPQCLQFTLRLQALSSPWTKPTLKLLWIKYYVPCPYC